MTRSTGVKRLLAVLLCAALIASCITVAGVAAVSGAARGFEGQTVGADLALSNPYKNTMQVSDAQAHDGSRSLLVHTGSSGGSSRPQLLMQGASGQDFKTQAGGEYQISFWYYVPAEQNVTQLLCWFGAKNGNDKTAFSGWYDADPNSKKGHLLSAAYSGTVKNDELLITPVAGQWTQVTLTVTDTVTTDGGYMIMGIAAAGEGNLDFYLDDITVKSLSAPGSESWGTFEGQKIGDDLALSNTYKNTMQVSDAQGHESDQSLLVHSAQNGGSSRPQLLLKDADGQDFKTQAGGKYQISFWYYVPEGQNVTQLLCWFGAKNGNDKTAFSGWYDADPNSKKGHLLSAAYSGTVKNDELLITPVAGQWTQVTLTVTDTVTTDGGYMIMGIAAAGEGNLDFYLDDITVAAVQQPVGGEGWSFENETAGANLSMNSNPMTVTSEQACDGAQSLKVVSRDNRGNMRAQLLLKDADGNTIPVKAGQRVTVSFWYYIQPDDTAISNGLSYWIAAADETTPFDGTYTKDAHKVVESTVNADLVKGTWTQLTCTGASKTDGFLRLGICPNSWGITTPIYLDSIVATVEDVGNITIPADPGATTLTFEKIPVGGAAGMLLRGSGAVDAAYNHTADGSRALRLEKVTNAGVYRNQLAVMDPSTGKPFEMTVGKKYILTFYVYIPENAVEGMKINYWLLSTDTLTAVDDKSAAEFDYGTGVVTDATGKWTQLQSIIEVKNGKHLILGITDFGLAEGAAFYIDDIHIEERVDRGITIDAQPGATQWDFETMPVGTGDQLQLRGVGMVDDSYNHTTGGSHSLKLQKLGQSGIERNQLVIMDQATGKPAELKMGQEYTFRFWAYLPEETADVVQLNFWLLTTNDLQAVNDKSKAEYDMGGFIFQVISGEWEQVETTITVTNGKYLVLGITDHNSLPTGAYYYLDDFEMITVEPEYLTVHFDTNGSPDSIEDVVARIGAPLTMPSVDPYREGYEFTGWYRDKKCSANSLFDEKENIDGVNGGEITLYAGWKKFAENRQDSSPQETIRYETEYYEEWEPTQQELLEFGESSLVKPAGTVNRDQPDKNTDASDPTGIAPWLILLIIGGAVIVVGGGAVLALVLLKRKKV